MARARWDAVIGAGVAVALMVAAWLWQSRATQLAGVSNEADAWQHVRERFPMPSSAAVVMPPPSEEWPAAIVRANPFSPERQPPPSAPGADSSTAAAPPAAPQPPQFAYKGRIMMGGTPRAIVEDVAGKKTYFAQIGQEVRGFRVEAIEAQAVTLADLSTGALRVIPLAAKATTVLGREQ